MSLYTRLMGIDMPKIPVHGFMSVMQEYMLGNMTGAQASAAFNLNGAEQAEALALRNVIQAESNANANLARRLKALELENVLICGEMRVAPYDTEAAVKTRLGV